MLPSLSFPFCFWPCTQCLHPKRGAPCGIKLRVSRRGSQQTGSSRRRATHISIALALLLLLLCGAAAARENREIGLYCYRTVALLSASFCPDFTGDYSNRKNIFLISRYSQKSVAFVAHQRFCEAPSARFTPILLIVTLSSLPSSLWFPPPFADTSSAQTTARLHAYDA